MSSNESKMVLVYRKDLKTRRGKEMAQAGHGYTAWITRRLSPVKYMGTIRCTVELSPAEAEWLSSSFAKVCLQVEDEAELRAIYGAAKRAGLEAHLIIDSGRTEFKGVPTATCVGIGPDYSSKIDPITGHLKLY